MSTPTKIVRLGEESNSGPGLHVEWSDGLRCDLEAVTLRRACPCATCKESVAAQAVTAGRRRLNVVQATRDESLRLLEIRAVGNYAISIRWGDGHDSGIYTYSLLRALSAGADKTACSEARPSAAAGSGDESL